MPKEDKCAENAPTIHTSKSGFFGDDNLCNSNRPGSEALETVDRINNNSFYCIDVEPDLGRKRSEEFETYATT
jgi:hypothetical protein